MARRFLNDFNLIVRVSEGDFENTTEETCAETITHYEFYQYTLILAVLITLTFTFTRPRRQALLGWCHGRPGIIFPMDVLTRTHRISYACAFGAMAYLVYEIVLEQTYAINYTGDDKAVKSFVAIVSMVIYGLVFYPLFTGLAMDSVYGYVMASLYVWMLTALHVYRIFDCHEATTKARIMVFLRGLPTLLCLVYLCISIPVRVVLAYRQGCYFNWKEEDMENQTLSEVRVSYYGLYVTDLFRKPKVELPPETTKGRVIGTILSLCHRFIYKRKSGFRYSSLMMAVLLSAVLVIYELTFEVLVLSVLEFDVIIGYIQSYVEETVGMEKAANETQDLTYTRELLLDMVSVFTVSRICIIVATVLAAVSALLNILHALSSYRANLYALYRGDYSHIPPASSYSNTIHCVGSIKYAGYQVGYIIWSYVIQGVIFFLLSIVLAFLISLLKHGITGWLLFILGYAWPVILTFVLMMILQYIMARFVFLQERGLYLALDNRELYFNFTYFIFFYNIFLGAASCLLRILKAMLLGLAFLSRLDSSTLSRRFESFDPGFNSYVGYMHMEAAHTHPVMIVFCRLMLLGLGDKRGREKQKSTLGGRRTAGDSSTGQVELVTMNKLEHDSPCGNGYIHNIPNASTTNVNTVTTTTSHHDEEEHRRRSTARFNWHMMYTLIHNPDIRVLRKGCLQMLRQARLMGVYIPVSDRMADVNCEQLHERLADAKEKMRPSSSKKTKTKGHYDFVEVDLGEGVSGVKKGDKKKAKNASSAGVLASQVHYPLAAAFHEISSDVNTPVPQKHPTAESADTPAHEENQHKETGDAVPAADLPGVQMSHDGPHGGQPGQDRTQQGDKHHTAVLLDTASDNCIVVCL